jgi:hypothetical protein
MRERFSLRDLVKYGLILSGFAMDPATFASAEYESARSWVERVQLLVGTIDLKAVAACGIRLLARMELSAAQFDLDAVVQEPSLLDLRIALQPDINANRILLSTESLVYAMWSNALHLHIPMDILLQDELEFPSPQHGDTSSDLVPTRAQLTLAHHPIFDTVPWAAFRTNICLAISQEPPLINDDELCMDLMNDGIRCWGSSKGSLNGRGQGAPWDARSWEAAPWFLEKYEFLTGGRDSEMWKNSAWWRSMR